MSGSGESSTPIERLNSQATRYGVVKADRINAQKLGSMVGSACLADIAALHRGYQQTYPQKL
jgi:hypothetical protein